MAVIGGGVSGLRAARRLAEAGADVTVLEASPRIGGQVHTVEVAGVPVDTGAEAMHLGAPGVTDLLDSLGLTDDMVTARPGASWIVTPRGLRRLPAGVGPAGPTRLRPVLRSGVMTVPGLVRAGLEPIVAQRVGGIDLSPGEDRSVGDFVGSRFGGQVVDRFVDPLLGSLHAGDVRTLSLRATTPSLVPAATAGRSLVRKRRPARTGAAPTMSFVSWREGLDRVVTALASGLDVHTDTPVEVVERLTPGEGRERGGYRVVVGGSDPRTLDVDGLVLATPGDVTARLLAEVSPEASAPLTLTDRASVATIVLAYPRHVVEALPAFRGTGVLVPSRVGSLLKAATFLSTKWPQLDHPEWYFCRLSAGRAGDDRLASFDDDELLARVRGDLRTIIGLDVAPRHALVQRWPHAMPQLTVGHPDRVATARAALPAGVTIAGSSYDGVGIASCLTSATRAADTLLDHLGLTATQGDRPV
ncbi:putative protoporphyrinogen oxidase [Mobilicoccus pelagius NBRC 104925]|uniref:Coproporphyrinogen III oxidase n=1 Tax=Mobilicoccus pelagius NBRC 104925 TaxID=1089455 RepID=H5UU55_9MICO|nr:putative protoporphyrinogen oxidase [Mobilicoccus pelagius NBRC 104925]